MESLAPLPSLSLPFQGDCCDVPFPSSSSSVEIGPGPRRPHEIDVFEGYLRPPPPSSSGPRTRKTGTTIVALLAENSTVLILAADTRATDGTTVADKRCEKLHALAGNVWCAGAGTSADVEALVRRTRHVFRGRGRTEAEGRGGVGNSADDGPDDRDGDDGGGHDGGRGQPPPASVTAVVQHLRTQLRKSRGGLGANLLAGGYDAPAGRAFLAAIHPHGSVDVVSYSALGSGGPAAMGVLESGYPRMMSSSPSSCSSSSRSSCTVAEGMRLAVDAVQAGIDNDLGSGSQVDVCVIGRGGAFYRRAVAREEELRWTAPPGGGDDAAAAADDGTSGAAGDGMEGDKRRISSRKCAGTEMGIGVNGFGNVPFAIESRRVVRGGRSDLDAERERRSWLDEVLSPE